MRECTLAPSSEHDGSSVGGGRRCGLSLLLLQQLTQLLVTLAARLAVSVMHLSGVRLSVCSTFLPNTNVVGRVPSAHAQSGSPKGGTRPASTLRPEVRGLKQTCYKSERGGSTW